LLVTMHDFYGCPREKQIVKGSFVIKREL
jgi:hypothetical protein